MAYNKLHVVITLIGALVAAVFSYLSGDSVFVFSVKFLAAVAIFYVLGCVIRAYLRARFAPEEAEAGEADKEDDEALTGEADVDFIEEQADDTDEEAAEDDGDDY
jgi:flagellar biosynthesis/type III secretory pathway M-ring protein FliF/YscJ